VLDFIFAYAMIPKYCSLKFSLSLRAVTKCVTFHKEVSHADNLQHAHHAPRQGRLQVGINQYRRSRQPGRDQRRRRRHFGGARDERVGHRLRNSGQDGRCSGIISLAECKPAPHRMRTVNAKAGWDRRVKSVACRQPWHKRRMKSGGMFPPEGVGCGVRRGNRPSFFMLNFLNFLKF
jgi:hypothetical protein